MRSKVCHISSVGIGQGLFTCL